MSVSFLSREVFMNPWEKRHKFMMDQAKAMNDHRWIESEKAARDLGEAAYLDWVAKFAKEFREAWESENGPVVEETNAKTVRSSEN